MAPFDIAKETLSPILAKMGFVKCKKTILSKTHPRFPGQDFLLEWGMADDFLTGKVQLYLANAYPDQKEECRLNVWGMIGGNTKRGAKEVAALLSRHGIKARATVQKGDTVVAFQYPFDFYAKIS